MSLSAQRITGLLATGLCAALLAGCSAGNSGVGTSTLPPQSRNPALSTQSMKITHGNVTFAVGITPKAKARRITPKYVSPSTQSLQILTDGANPVVVNVTPSSPNCSANPAVPGSYICTASLIVPSGNHIFTVTTYDVTGAQGNVLSTNGTGTIYVYPTGFTRVSIVLEGVVHYVVLTLTKTNPPIGKAATIGLTATLEDADQNLIVGPTSYKYPVTLTTTDPTDGPLSKAALHSPADASGITANYTGANVASITYSAIATGLSAANVINAVLTPGAKTQHLYVSSVGSTSVNVFDLGDPTAAPTTITGGGLKSPYGVAVDASGKLYVANEFANSVSVFDTAHGNAALPAITGNGLNEPLGVALDTSGKLYVANFDPRFNSVSVFDTLHGYAALPPITGGGLNQSFGAAVDASGKLYVANHYNDSVSVFDTTHGNAALPVITGGGLSLPSGVVVDTSGKLYVANYGSTSISVFDTAHGNAVLPAITGGGMNQPNGVALDASGKLFAANWFERSVSIFDTAHGYAALPAITGGPMFPGGLAVH